MKKEDKTLLYYMIIFISVIDIIAGIFCAGKLGINILGEHFNKRRSTFEAVKPVISPILSNILYAFGAAVSFGLYIPLTKYRQKLRDEVEYDENGIAKKSHFSQLSKKERDEIERQKTIDRERILPTSVIKNITHVGSKNPEEELNKLIGLNNIKEEVKKMIARMEFEKNKGNSGPQSLTSMNMLMSGNPGTGKTTLSRIMASFLYKYGYIKKNQSIEVDGNFFNGLSKGESSKRTSALIQAARGGVLFIDEAYALLTGGQEVIATIVKAMEDYRDDTVFIFAGYAREMGQFIESNSGLKSRFKYHMKFNDYSSDELAQIFTHMAHEAGFCVNEETLIAAVNVLNKKRTQPFFGNARDVRNLLDKAIDNHALFIKENNITNTTQYYLLANDIPNEC